jgi:hypothetical protein
MRWMDSEMSSNTKELFQVLDLCLELSLPLQLGESEFAHQEESKAFSALLSNHLSIRLIPDPAVPCRSLPIADR